MSFPRHNGLRSFEFGSEPEMKTRLANLVRDGIKKATAGQTVEYFLEGEVVENVGERLVVLDGSGQSVGTVVVTKVEVLRFDEIPDSFALAEGEGDLNADDFRKSHSQYWESIGTPVTGETKIVTVSFELEN